MSEELKEKETPMETMAQNHNEESELEQKNSEESVEKKQDKKSVWSSLNKVFGLLFTNTKFILIIVLCLILPLLWFILFTYAMPNFYDSMVDGIKKPVIYAYGYDKIELQLDLSEDTELYCSYPLYENSWKFNMENDKFIANDKVYDYLYYEAITKHKFSIDKGFCVNKDNIVAFLEDKLNVLGLNDRETEDFITYWLPSLMQYDYSIISFQQEELEDIVKLNVTETPDTIIRVYMVWKGLNYPVDIETQNLIKANIRTGKTIVEWGGTELQ